MIEQLKQFIKWEDAELLRLDASLGLVFKRFEINSPRRIRYFMAQAYFETQGFTKFEENLYYSNPGRLVEVWRSRFTTDTSDMSKALAQDYIKNPQKLASLVYASRLGNGNAESGDGYKFRGRGLFHLTFKDNYRACSQYLYEDSRLVDNPDGVALIEDACASAGWFWHINKLNELADADQFTKMTGVINGSTATAHERLKVLDLVNTIF